MGVSFEELGQRAREQVLAKVAIEQVRRMNQTGKKASKYKSEKVSAFLLDGTPHTFDSRKEYDRYQELALMERAGQISNLKTQVTYELIPAQREPDIFGPRGGVKRGKLLERECSYVADFVYTDSNGETVVEDVKGYRDPASAAYAKYTIKRKLMLWIHGIRIREI